MSKYPVLDLSTATPVEIVTAAIQHVDSWTSLSDIAAEDNGYCRYRKGEAACLVGIFMPDADAIAADSLTSGLGAMVDDLPSYEGDLSETTREALRVNMILLSDMQDLHDTVVSPSSRMSLFSPAEREARFDGMKAELLARLEEKRLRMQTLDRIAARLSLATSEV